MLGELIASKTRLRLLIKFFISQANRGYLNGLANEMGESTNSIRKELNHLHGAGYLNRIKVDNKIVNPNRIKIKHTVEERTDNKTRTKNQERTDKHRKERIKHFDIMMYLLYVIM